MPLTEVVTKKTVKLKDMAQLGAFVDISAEEQFFVRPLNLREMITLFITSRDAFLSLFSAGVNAVSSKDLAGFMVASPDLVAHIIALASDEPDGVEMVKSKLSGPVQLIALWEVWKASVPDAKKLNELLSEVTALLQKRQNEIENEVLLKSSTPT